MKKLPGGSWLTFRHLHPDTTDADVQNLILERTGVEIPYECIEVTTYQGEARTAIVSLDRHAVCSLLQWALTDDRLRGRPITLAVPEKKR